MSPSVALLLWLVLLICLLRFDPAQRQKASLALWVPVIWMFILGSRLPSQWLGGQVGMAAQAMEEGNPLDRLVSTSLILLALGILASRRFNWRGFFARNIVLTMFLSFALLSVIWSDSPFVTFKRWFRDLGNYLMIAVTLTDPFPLEALRAVLRRLCFLLIPLSVVLVKYYPAIGKQYDYWTGVATYTGATTSKNMLGVACLISGLFFFWDTVTRWNARKQRSTRWIILQNLILIAMTLWLLNIANSATSRLCLLLGCLIVAAAHTGIVQRHPTPLKVLIPISFLLYLILAFGYNLNAQVASTVGRDPTLTDRTKIWKFLLTMQANPVCGAGYETFWLGPRLTYFWQNSGLGRINEAHNGYLEVYLNLGIIGVALLIGFLIAGYLMICKQLKPFSSVASFSLALWTVLLFYNVSEAAFRSGLMWFVYLTGALAIPMKPKRQLVTREPMTCTDVSQYFSASADK